MAAWDRLVAIGAIAGAHGNRGEVSVVPLTSFPGRFARTRVVFTCADDGEPVPLELERERPQGDRHIIKFRGIETIDAAERLAHKEIRVAPEELEPLPPHTYFLHNLVGCRVTLEGGVFIGTVRGVVETGAAVVLEVMAGASREPAGKEPILIPLAQEICVRIDTRAREIVVRPPAGLLDLNR